MNPQIKKLNEMEEKRGESADLGKCEEHKESMQGYEIGMMEVI